MTTSPAFASLARSWRPAGLTQAEASRLLCIAPSTLNKIEHGVRGGASWVLYRMRTVYALGDDDIAAGLAALAADRALRMAGEE
jgi:transcriptional regulator with XRE-family HTH domain